MGWEQAGNELNRARAQEQARQKHFEELATDAAKRLVRVLDPRIKQFVQTLHDHDQWPTESKQVTEKQRVAKGLLFTRFEEKTVTKTVVKPSLVIIEPRGAGLGEIHDLRISSSQEWWLGHRFVINDWGTTEYGTFYSRTAEGTHLTSSSFLVKWSSTDPRGMELAVNLDAVSNALVKAMASYLMERSLPLPRD
jgi:hypothetical protein